MNKLWIKVLISLIMQMVSIEAATLNVFNSNEDADIYINRNFVGKQQLIDHDIKEGSHLLEVKINKSLIHSEIIAINKDEVKTISTDNFVKSKSILPNANADVLEVKRSLKAKGNFGLGVTAGSLPGLTIGIRSNKVGMQFTGLYSSDEYSTSYIYEIRGLYYLKDKIINNLPASIYLTLGAGEAATTDYYKHHADIMLGVELSLSSNRPPSLASFSSPYSLIGALLSLDNMYFNFDIGYGYGYVKNSILEYWGEGSAEVETQSVSTVARMGLKMYF